MKGGCLMIGYKVDKKIKMEEIKVESSDILALEGTVRGCKTRIILVYVDSKKKIKKEKIMIEIGNYKHK